MAHARYEMFRRNLSNVLVGSWKEQGFGAKKWVGEIIRKQREGKVLFPNEPRVPLL